MPFPISAIVATIGPVVVDKLFDVLKERKANPNNGQGNITKKDIQEAIPQAIELAAQTAVVKDSLKAKPWWQSATVQSALAVVVFSLVGAIDGTVTAGDAESFAGLVTQALTAVFGMVAIWGRIRAKGPVT